MASLLRRRDFLAGGALALGLSGGWRLAIAGDDASRQTIVMAGTPKGDAVWFDPVGVWVPPGTTIRWITPDDQTQKHATAAYHPANKSSPLRIPGRAAPWNSGYIGPGAFFDFQLTEEGVYDYYCAPHEEAGMVGRIVVGTPSGHELADFERNAAAHPAWRTVPEEALRVFPAVEEIMRRKAIPYQPG
jgi:plastocyanin